MPEKQQIKIITENSHIFQRNEKILMMMGDEKDLNVALLMRYDIIKKKKAT